MIIQPAHRWAPSLNDVDPSVGSATIADSEGSIDALSGPTTWSDDGGNLSSVQYGSGYNTIAVESLSEFTIGAHVFFDTSGSDAVNYPVGLAFSGSSPDAGGTGAGGIYISRTDGTARQVAYYDGATAIRSTSQITFDTWTHVLARVKGDYAEVWIDGDVAASGTVLEKYISNGFLGFGSGVNFYGRLDDVVFYDRYIDPAEIYWLSQNRASREDMYVLTSNWGDGVTLRTKPANIFSKIGEAPIDLSLMPPSFWSTVDATGNEIIVCEKDTGYRLETDLEAWNYANQTGTLWIGMKDVSATTEREILILTEWL